MTAYTVLIDARMTALLLVVNESHPQGVQK